MVASRKHAQKRRSKRIHSKSKLKRSRSRRRSRSSKGKRIPRGQTFRASTSGDESGPGRSRKRPFEEIQDDRDIFYLRYSVEDDPLLNLLKENEIEKYYDHINTKTTTSETKSHILRLRDILARGNTSYWESLVEDAGMKIIERIRFEQIWSVTFANVKIEIQPIENVVEQNKLLAGVLLLRIYESLLYMIPMSLSFDFNTGVNTMSSIGPNTEPIYDSLQCSFELQTNIPFSENNPHNQLEGKLKNKFGDSISIKGTKQGPQKTTILICTCDATADELQLPFDFQDSKDIDIGDYKILKEPTLDGYIVSIKASRKNFPKAANSLGYIAEGPFWNVGTPSQNPSSSLYPRDDE